jgi:signal transduction histidine kinase
MIAIFFLYGLTFFVMGMALAIAGRQDFKIPFVKAIPPLAAFGILHGIHEWIHMFQLIAAQVYGYMPTPLEEAGRHLVLVLSFIMLLWFGLSLPETNQGRRLWWVLALAGSWGASVAAIVLWQRPDVTELLTMADVLARYILGIPSTLLAAWALMLHQRTLRKRDMPQIGRDLLWCAAALFFYGIIGQLFVKESALPPSQWLNSDLFYRWFGIPIELFRGSMAVVLTYTMLRAMAALDLENRRRLESANQRQLATQARALEAVRKVRRECEQLNAEIKSQARELALLLDLSNRLAAPRELNEQLTQVLRQVVHNLPFFDAGMILLTPHGGGMPDVEVQTGFTTNGQDEPEAVYDSVRELAGRSLVSGRAVCRHVDNVVIEFNLESALFGEECWQHPSPTAILALPLVSQAEIIGAMTLARAKTAEHLLTLADLKLLAGIARQLALSIENVRLYRQAQEREKLLGDLLSQVVGAQEAERQRIARDLHDATGQSLSAISLGLRGIENTLAGHESPIHESLTTIQQFATDAIGELRRIIADLRPPQLDDLGLVAALRWYVQSFRQRHAQLEVDLSIEGESIRLPRHTETTLFRIVQEAMTNIAKHADASHVIVDLAIRPGTLTLLIEDNGRGFDLERTWQRQQSGWGILGIRERANLLGAECHIDSAPGKGARVEVRVSLAGYENSYEPALLP